MGMVQFRAPALPLLGDTYNQRQADELLRALRIYFNQLDSLNAQPGPVLRELMHSLVVSSRALGLTGAPSQDLVLGLEVPYALLMSDEDQDSAGTTSENIVTLNRIIFSDGINVENNSRITFAYPGQYLITARFQFANRGNALQEFEDLGKEHWGQLPLKQHPV
jgi:hypothetical protein